MADHVPAPHPPGAQLAAPTSAVAGAGGRYRVPSTVGLAAVLTGCVLVAALHVLHHADVDPVRRTISEYALGPTKWLFDLAVLLVATGSGVLFGVLVHSRTVRPLSPAAFGGAGWTLGLLAVVVFPKTDWSIGPSLAGTIHRYASVVAFVALPVAVLAAARAVHPHAPGLRLLTRVLGLASLAWLGLIVGAVLLMLAGGDPWWRALPLGLVERGLLTTEVAALAVVAAGCLRLRTPAPPSRLVTS